MGEAVLLAHRNLTGGKAQRPSCLGFHAKSRTSTIRRIRNIHLLLRARYGTPDLGNVEDVFGELIYALLSTRSIPTNYQRVFSDLRARYPRWFDLARARRRDLEVLLRPCGLNKRKARAIVAIARRVFLEDKYADLEHLRNLPTEQAEAYLTSLPEVGVKVAKCVCLYALHRPVFPVDVHNLRVLKRLGVLDHDAQARSAAREIETVIPPSIRHDLHVNLVVHGRNVCRARPLCDKCILLDICPYLSSKSSHL